uniref:BLTX744 n=1 Tax=Nephila pilipes TaxID=299642 RepID=A0A076L355_NEPPI|nr:BLTX744 [Nephila pilipes]
MNRLNNHHRKSESLNLVFRLQVEEKIIATS